MILFYSNLFCLSSVIYSLIFPSRALFNSILSLLLYSLIFPSRALLNSYLFCLTLLLYSLIFFSRAACSLFNA